MPNNNVTTGRKRSRTAVGLGITLTAMTLWCNPSAAFTTHSAARVPSFPGHGPSSPLAATKQPGDGLTLAPHRLSAEEQRDLLLQAIELRRIQTLERELAMSSSKKSPPLLLIRSQEAGYGEDLMAYETAIREGERAREALITTNMGLVHHCVNDIIGTGGRARALNSLSRDDLVQEGAIGMARAIDRWNPAIGGKFSTYAVYWVRAAILRCIAEKDDLLRVPEHVSTAVRKMTRGARKLGLELDSDSILSTVYAADASWKEAKAARALAEEAGLTDKQLTEAMRIRNRRNAGGYVEFESWMQKGADLESDVSTVVSREEPLRSIAMDDIKKTLARYLRPKEMEALFWRYGLFDESAGAARDNQPKDYLAQVEEELYGNPNKLQNPSGIPVGGKWGEAMSFKEVGKNMEVSAEYGRRLCHGALKKLRQAAKEGRLEPAFLL